MYRMSYLCSNMLQKKHLRSVRMDTHLNIYYMQGDGNLSCIKFQHQMELPPTKINTLFLIPQERL